MRPGDEWRQGIHYGPWGMLGYLKKYINKEYRTQKEAAKSLGVSQGYLSDVLAGRREVGDKLAKQLGYEKGVVYQPLSDNEGEDSAPKSPRKTS